jgi:hypothetical protein
MTNDRHDPAPASNPIGPGADHGPGHGAGQSAEQLRYAVLLDWGTRIGLLVLVASFVAYVSGLLQSQVPLQRLPELWALPVASYLEQTQMPTGWGWLALVLKGDVVGLVGIAILAGCSVLCLLALVPLYARRGDKAYVWLCLAEVAVVVLAASGLISGGH